MNTGMGPAPGERRGTASTPPAAAVTPWAAGPRTFGFLPVAFVEQARAAARAVGRVVTRRGTAIGTGFLISPALLITSHHVVPDEARAGETLVEFDYELDERGRERTVTRLPLAPDAFFLTDARADMDFTVVAVGEPGRGVAPGVAFGFRPLAERRHRHSLGSFVNLVQHPHGMHKQVTLRENVLVHYEGSRLYYTAGTLDGSSGAPVFNDRWQVVAVHHRAGAARPVTLPSGEPLPGGINEGIRATAVFDALTRLASGLDPARRALLDVVLEM
jgi:endonuclease G